MKGANELSERRLDFIITFKISSDYRYFKIFTKILITNFDNTFFSFQAILFSNFKLSDFEMFGRNKMDKESWVHAMHPSERYRMK